MAGWTDDEVFKLIEIWNEDGIQEQLEGSKRNKHVYEKLCTQLRGAGYVRTGEQCRSKVKKLRQQYKKIKDNNGMTGRGRGKWRFFDALDEVFGHRPATRPPVIFDTTDDQQSTDSHASNRAVSQPAPPSSASKDVNNPVEEEDTDTDGEETSTSVVPSLDHSIMSTSSSSSSSDSTSDGTGSASDNTISGSDNTGSGNTGSGSDGNTSTSSGSGNTSTSSGIASDNSEASKKDKEKTRKKRKTREEQLENVLTKVMKTVTDGMRDTEKMFIEVEEKRLSNEAEQRREERQFKLQLAQIFAGQPSSPPYHYQLSTQQLSTIQVITCYLIFILKVVHQNLTNFITSTCIGA